MKKMDEMFDMDEEIMEQHEELFKKIQKLRHRIQLQLMAKQQPLSISDEARVQMPMKTVASLICMVAIGTWAYFGIIETQNKLSTQVELMSKDLTENTEFRIKWPRGQLGSLPADSEQFMMSRGSL